MINSLNNFGGCFFLHLYMQMCIINLVKFGDVMQVKCKLIKEVYRNEINGYNISVVKIINSDNEELVKEKSIYAVGVMESLNERLTYLLEGNIEMHPKYGKQFKVTSYKVNIPTKEEELVEFLSSKMFPIGAKTASRIVDMFGSNTIEIILDDYTKLKSIPRLTEDKIIKIHDILKQQQTSSEIVIKLGNLGFTPKECGDILAKYKNQTLNVIENNIYRLIEDLDFKFSDIDKIAISMNVDIDNDNRLKSLVIYLINSITFNSGSTYVLINELFDYVIKYADISMDKLEGILNSLIKELKVIKYKDNYYLTKFYKAEVYIANRLCSLSDKPKHKFPNLEDKIRKMEIDNDIKYDEIQKKAIIDSLNNNFTIITGGPGTGKTTIIKAIVNLLCNVFHAKDRDIALLAPTGRAARRMYDTTGIYASTIHKYLIWDKDTDTFSKDEYNPNDEKYVIVDEVSMIDTLLMEALLKGIKKDAKLILVGDYYQLPSVSQGQVLKDLIDCDMLDVVVLNNLYRQNESSYIPVLAQEIKNKYITDKIKLKTNDYNFIECSNDQVLSVVSMIVEMAINKGYNESNIQLLAPMYKSLNGIDNLNKVLQKLFNKQNGKEIKVGDSVFNVGDKVLQLVNDSDLSISNGDIGYIVDILPNKKTKSQKAEMIIDFDGNFVNVTQDKFINLKHGYAISVHKSQGNEFEMVILPVVNSFYHMLYNKLLYTAVTRAKKSLIIVGSKEVFLRAVKSNKDDDRKTNLKEFIINYYCNMV